MHDAPVVTVAAAVANMRRAPLAERAGARSAEQARNAHGAGRAALQRGAHADEKRTRPPCDAVGADARPAIARTHRATEDEAARENIKYSSEMFGVRHADYFSPS